VSVRLASSFEDSADFHEGERHGTEAVVRCSDSVVFNWWQSREQANAYLTSGLFTSDIVGALKPLLDAEPDVRIYKAAA
jgi:hypothetical protein